MQKHIFIDLDETLFHTEVTCPAQMPPIEAYTKFAVMNYGTEKKPHLYRSQLRPGAHRMLDEIRKRFPAENIHVLTTSVQDYARDNNRIHRLGFDESRIYARGHLHGEVPTPRIVTASTETPVAAYLIDNLPRYELAGKISFMNRTGFPIGDCHIFQISEYLGGPAESMDDFGAIGDHELKDIITFLEGGLKDKH